MPSISEVIPLHLRDDAEAARAWFSEHEGSQFKLTGIMLPGDANSDDTQEAGSRELQLILCGIRDGQDVCLRERFRVSATEGGHDVDLVRDESPEFGSVAPLLDPPAGVRAQWLDDTRPKHAFTVLLFYRGFW